uniref:NADH dehydrogenase subunit 4 n=1 Tax=Argopistes sexvittatus TaxID=2995641 RepID=UPI00237A2AE6|nr:NADH dehydrogenase subunit 4 [Argopistes sexvittatus]WBV77038.1 NADH dehydrogenase subunit 4 [Argopistes sexvittatus]WBV77051.1 NADH dehydrogenase subunit 4 [Argopistes sexvittatus]
MMKFLMALIMLNMISFFIDFWLFLWILLIFTFIFIFNFLSNYFCEISYWMGCDMLSFSLILLSYWICSLMILASFKLYKDKYYFYFFNFMLSSLLISLFITFSSLNIFIFYLFFEISLIPIMILIIGWGYQPERLEAGFYLLFYTLFMSLPMMIMVFYLYNYFGSMIYFFMKDLDSIFMYLCMNMVFFVKIPMFFLHLWLPKAHVEAPVSGSMILAGIMLKLGGYGLLRFMVMFKLFLNSLNILFLVISLLGGFIVSLICLRQNDLKSLIAYSSVAHMGLALAGIMTLNFYGFYGCLFLMIAHGLCSSGLFCWVNLVYERTHSRSLYLNKGLLNLLPSLSLWSFLLLSSNMAAPPSLNLLSEIMLINSIIQFNWLNMLMLSLISFFSAAYSLFLFAYTQHGMFYSGIFSFMNIENREFLLLFLHWVPLNLLFMKVDIFF